MAGARKLRVLHFNDLYHAVHHSDGRRDIAVRFMLSVQAHMTPDTLVLCSGDVLAPSLLSTFTKGRHMMEVIEAIGVHYATFGNHDFDFGVEHTKSLLQPNALFRGTRQAKSVWVTSNLKEPVNGGAIAGGEESVLFDWHGVKVGLLAVSEEWLGEAGVTPEEGSYENHIEVAKRVETSLRSNGAEIVLALAHSMEINTRALAEAVPGINFIFGGHEHYFTDDLEQVRRQRYIISGWDFFDFSTMVFDIPLKGLQPTLLDRIRVNFEADLPDELPKDVMELKTLLDEYNEDCQTKLREPIGRSLVELDARKWFNRTRETPLGNLISDIFLSAPQFTAYRPDVCFIIAGILSSHRIWPPGDLSMETMVTIFPWEGTVMMVELTGEELRLACENGVSLLPRRFGRFPQVAGMSFGVDASKPSGERVSNLMVGKDPVDLGKVYRVVTTEFIARGGEGYSMFRGAKMVVSDENGPPVYTVVHQGLASNKEGVSPVVEGRVRNLTPFKVVVEPSEESEFEGQDLMVPVWSE